MEPVKLTCNNAASIDLFEWDSVYFPRWPWLREGHLEALQTLPLRENDIFLCSYPKAGSHWITEITNMLLNGKTDKYQLPTLPLAGMSMEYIENELPSPRIMNNHLYPRHMPEGATKHAKVIFISRNPKDVAVSLYHFVAVAQGMDFTGDWDEFLELFLEGKVPYKSWWDYTLEWWETEKSNPNVLWVSYEDLHEDCLSQLRRVNEFLDTSRSEEFMKDVAKCSSFKSMQKAIQPQHARFLRKGGVGGWKNWFTVAQNEKMDNFHRLKMGENSDFKVRFEL